MDLSDPDIDQLIVRYLLSALDEGSRQRFEELYFDDDAMFERLVTVEIMLIQEYVTGTLSPEERGRFETYYLRSADRQQRVEKAKSTRPPGNSLKIHRED